MAPLFRILLYDDPRTPISASEVAAYLRETVRGAEVVVRREFFEFHKVPPETARAIAALRVKRPDRPPEGEVLGPEVAHEERVLKGEARPLGLLYDGFRFAEVCRGLIPREEATLDRLHLLLTSRLLGTLEEDGRYHARVVVLSHPSILSAPGLRAAPAMPKEFYFLRRSPATASAPEEVLREQFRGRYLEEGQFTEAAKGYALQAVFYQRFGEPFCGDRRCRLFNAHWQEEVLEAQIRSRGLCDRHREMLKESR